MLNQSPSLLPSFLPVYCGWVASLFQTVWKAHGEVNQFLSPGVPVGRMMASETRRSPKKTLSNSVILQFK